MDSGEYRAEADLLHPLATLHWEHCHTWRERDTVYHTHCAVLHDKIAILTWMFGSTDVLHISTDLNSWTTNTLPYEGMSLTTYQSMFVAVGGRHPSTKEPTDQLFTSDTGLQWLPSLPPMPTKRSRTSSVTTGSPEVLVVAGGMDLGGWHLDVVQLLLGNEWSTVDPLPVRCWFTQSTLHDENLYFMGGIGQGATVYTCSCAALISSCGNTTTKDRPLWRQFNAPDSYTAAVSYSSRLVSIDGWCTIRAYSSMSQSWVNATSTGERSDENTAFVAAAVLPTGELVFSHRYDGVFKVKLSVASFDPDSSFMYNVLSRLEAVMGIQILSALANNHSQLSAKSGVQLPEYTPDPEIYPDKYVEEVISQWSAGHGNRPPTWRYLLEVLRDIGLLELSQQIDTFMKGEMKFVDAYRHFINTKDVLELLFLKFLFVGPPRLGKTTARRRLMGEITDLISASEADQHHPSTGAVESGHNMVVRNVSYTTAVVTQAEWSSLENLSDEARMLFHSLVDSIEARDIPMPPPELSNPLKSISQTSQASFTSNASKHQQAATPEPSLIKKFFSKIKSLKINRQRKQYRDIPEVAAIFRESVQPVFWKETKQSLKAYLRMEDTGGQPELMDMLPALTVGPGLYLLFFSYELKLKCEFKVSFQSSSGESSIPEQSRLTLEEMLLSALSSISCSNSSANLMKAEETTSSDMHKILESSRSVAYIVGTHKDKVSEEYIATFDKELQSIIRDTDFFEKDIIQFCSEGKLVVSMDNMGGGAEEVNEIHKLLERAMENHFKKLKIPAVWLLFSLCLRMRDVRTTSMECCLELSSLFNMSPYETKVALWFLHHHAGVMMYFPNVPGLEDLVIIDIQIVYDSVTNIILRAMSFDNVGQAKAEMFRRTGQFILKDLIESKAIATDDLIPPCKLVALLVFLHIISQIFSSDTSSNEEEAVYIMPCVLESTSSQELDLYHKEACKAFLAAPLMVRYTCGFTPIGIFPAMIACLISNKLFFFIEEGVKKNMVQFFFGSKKSLVSFISRPRYFEIIISSMLPFQNFFHKECMALRVEVENTLEEASSRMNYSCYKDYQFSFQCPSHVEGDHLCVISRDDTLPEVMLCILNRNNPQRVLLQNQHRVWYDQEIPNIEENTRGWSDGNSYFSTFMRFYPDLISALKPCVKSVADYCISVGLISEDTYDNIIQRDIIDKDKARILLSNIRTIISSNAKAFDDFITVMEKVEACKSLLERMQTEVSAM